MCFAPQRRATTNHWKNTAIRDVANISRTCIFFLHDLTLHCFSTRLDCCCTLLFYTTLQLSILSEVSTLNFLRWYTEYINWCMVVSPSCASRRFCWQSNTLGGKWTLIYTNAPEYRWCLCWMPCFQDFNTFSGLQGLVRWYPIPSMYGIFTYVWLILMVFM